MQKSMFIYKFQSNSFFESGFSLYITFKIRVFTYI